MCTTSYARVEDSKPSVTIRAASFLRLPLVALFAVGTGPQRNSRTRQHRMPLCFCVTSYLTCDLISAFYIWIRPRLIGEKRAQACVDMDVVKRLGSGDLMAIRQGCEADFLSAQRKLLSKNVELGVGRPW